MTRLLTAAATVFLCAATVLGMSLCAPASAAAMDTPPAAMVVSWTNKVPQDPPPGRICAGLVYDTSAGKYVLFGGGNESLGFLNDTWTYDLGTNSWHEVTTTVHPDRVYQSAYAYDSVAGVTVVFGSIDDITSRAVNETWAYDASANQWSELKPADPPKERVSAAAAYDIDSGKMVLFGGVRYEGAHAWDMNDTWSYDFGTNTWTDMNPANPPPARSGHMMAYDSESDKIVLFGGYYEDPMAMESWFYGDTWAYDLDSNIWMNVTTPSGPPTTAWASAVYDPASDLTVLFGGFDNTGLSNKMWVYDDEPNSWTQIVQVSKPTPRCSSVMALNPTSSEAVLFGGLSETGSTMNDTWSALLGSNIPEFGSVPVILVAFVIAAIVMCAASTRGAGIRQ